VVLLDLEEVDLEFLVELLLLLQFGVDGNKFLWAVCSDASSSPWRICGWGLSGLDCAARITNVPKARELLKNFLVLSRKKNLERLPLLSVCLVGIGVGQVNTEFIELAQGTVSSS